MRNNYTHKTTIFFLSLLLVLTLFFSSSAFAIFTEDYQDDNAGSTPSEDWYTVINNVDTGVKIYGSEHMLGRNFTSNNAVLTSDLDYVPTNAIIYCNFSFNWSTYDAYNDWWLIDINDDAGNDVLAIKMVAGLKKLRYYHGTGNFLDPVVFPVTGAWVNCNLTINTTTEKWLISHTFGGSTYTYGWFTFQDVTNHNIKRFALGLGASDDTNVFHIDNLSFVMPPADTEIDINYPLNSSICNNATTDFSVQIWDNDTIDPQNAIIHLFQCDGLNTWEYIGAYNDSINSGDYFNGTFATCYNRTYAWYLNVTNADGTTFFPDAGWDWYNDSFNYSLSCIDDSHVYHFMTGCDNMSMIIYGYNDSSMLFDDTIETNSLNVQLHLNAPHADYMAFADDSDPLIYSDDWDYAPLFNYTLPCLGNGIYTIDVRYTDDCGYFYCNDTIIVNGSIPDMSINYPVEGETYTSIEWADNHLLDLIGNTDESYSIDLNVTSDDFYTFIAEDADFDANLDIDLEDYVWFDDQNYTITVFIENCFGNQTLIVNFTIGDPLTDLAKHISLKGLSPERENYTQVDLFEQGVTFDIICTELNGISYTYHMTDWDGYVLDEKDDITYLDEQYGWQTKTYYSGRYYTRNFYKTWLGIYNGTIDVQWDDLYGYESIQYNSFMDIPLYHYIFNNSIDDENETEGRYQLVIGTYLENESVLYDSYTGIMWGYGTFFIGDIIPFHSIGSSLYDRKDIYGDTWFQQYEDALPGIGILMAFSVILFFSIMPILLIHALPPMSIQLLFTEIGMVVAYAMGVFPLWIFELILIGILMAIFYKIFNWYRERSGVQSFADTPLGKAGIISAKGGAQELKSAWEWRQKHGIIPRLRRYSLKQAQEHYTKPHQEVKK